MATPINFVPTFTSTGAAPYTPGAIYTDKVTGYMYVWGQMVTAVGANGVCVVRSGSSVGIYIGANRGGVAGVAAGICVGPIAINSYGFFMVWGTHTAALSTSSTAGLRQKASGTNDTLTDATALTGGSYGYALTATSGGLCTMDVRCLGS